jgi:hypothetical protein
MYPVVKRPKIWLILSPVLFLLWNCTEKPNLKKDFLAVCQQEKEIHCELAALKDSIGYEWDNMNAMLEKNLPPDMPEAEKNNMLKVRNADLIRMFESFDETSEGVKSALLTVEQKDREMAARIVSLKEKLQEIESRKMALFEKIGELEGEAAVRNYKEMYRKSIAERCE